MAGRVAEHQRVVFPSNVGMLAVSMENGAG